MDDIVFCPKPSNVNWGTGCIIFNMEGQILIGLRSDNKLWGSPGGTVEPNETPYDAICRETLEESGLTVKFPQYLGLAYSYDEFDNSVWTSFSFVCYDYTGEVKRQIEEVDEYKWVYPMELSNYDLFRPFIQSLQIYNDYMGTNYPIQKMTSLDQLTGIHSPGTNGGKGHYNSNGKWSYDKPGKKITSHQLQSGMTGINRANPNKIQELKNSYIRYYNRQKQVQKLYKVENDQFVFPSYKDAIKQKLVKSKDQYISLFKEQYMLFSIFK